MAKDVIDVIDEGHDTHQLKVVGLEPFAEEGNVDWREELTTAVVVEDRVKGEDGHVDPAISFRRTLLDRCLGYPSPHLEEDLFGPEQQFGESESL